MYKLITTYGMETAKEKNILGTNKANGHLTPSHFLRIIILKE